jgi:hypothetical protein
MIASTRRAVISTVRKRAQGRGLRGFPHSVETPTTRLGNPGGRLSAPDRFVAR